MVAFISSLLLTLLLRSAFLPQWVEADTIINVATGPTPGGPVLVSPDGSTTFVWESVNATEDECQVCMSYYYSSRGTGNGWYRATFDSFWELDASGNECCTPGTDLSCSYGPGTCELHVMDIFNPIFTGTSDSQTANFTGAQDSSGVMQFGDPSCSPLGDEGDVMCVSFNFENRVILADSDVVVGARSNETMHMDANSIHMIARVNNWFFSPTSTGVRVKLLVEARGVSAESFKLQPLNLETYSSTSPTVGGFDQVIISDFYKFGGVITFANWAIVDGQTMPVTISGPYPLANGNKSTRYFNFDVLKKFTTLEFHMNVRVAAATEISGASNMTSSLSSMLLMLLLCVGTLLLS